MVDPVDRASQTLRPVTEPSLGALQWVWDHVVNGAGDAAVGVGLAAGGGIGPQGRLWPEADEAAMVALAEVWGRLVERLGTSREDLSAESNVVAEFYRGSAGMQFQFSNYQLQIDPLDVVGSALSYQTALRMGAANFAYAKMSIVMEGLLTATYVLGAMIRAMFSMGISSAEIPMALAAGRLAALGIFRRLLAALGGASVRGITSAARQVGTRAGRQAALHSARQGGLRQAVSHVGREARWEGLEEVVSHVGAVGLAAGRGYGDGLGDQFWQQFALSGGAGALGGVVNERLFAPHRLGRALTRGQEWLRGEHALRRFAADAVVSGARIGVTSSVSSWAATGLLNATPWFEFEGAPGLWDALVQGVPTGFFMGVTLGGASVPAAALGQRLAPVPVDVRTGLLTGPTRWGIDPVVAQRMVLDDRVNAGARVAGGVGGVGSAGQLRAEPAAWDGGQPPPRPGPVAGPAGAGSVVAPAPAPGPGPGPAALLADAPRDEPSSVALAAEGPGPPPASSGAEPEPAWPAVDHVIEGLRGQVRNDSALADAVAEKVSAMQDLASLDASYHRFLLGEAGLTVAEARSVVTGEPGSLDALRSRLQTQEDVLAAAANDDQELARALADAGVTETLPDRLTTLAQARAEAVVRNAGADDRLAAMDGAAHEPVASGLAQLRAALVEQVRAELVAAQVTRAGVPSPVAGELARQVVAATASGVRPEPWPLAEAVAAGIQDRLVQGGVLPGTAEALAGQLAELVAAGVRVTTVHAVIDDVVAQLHRRDPQDSFEALAGVLGLAWEMASSEPAPPAGVLVDAVARGAVEEANSLLGHRPRAVRGRRGSVQLDEPVHGVGSGRRFTLSVSSGLRPRAATVTVAEGSGPSHLEHQDGRAVLRLDPTSSVEAANAFIARAVAAIIDDLRANSRWRRRSGAVAPELSRDGILHKGPLPAGFQRTPRTRDVTATDVVELNLRVNRPFPRLATRERQLATLGPSDPVYATAVAVREAALDELREGATQLGLVGAERPTRAATIAAMLAELAGYVPPEVTDGLTRLDQEIAVEVRITGRLRTLLTGAGMSWRRAQELVEWVRTADADQRTARTWRLLRELPGLPQSQIVQLRFRRQVETLMDQLAAHLDRQRRQTVQIALSGMLGKIATHAIAADRYQAHASALAETLHTELTRAGGMSAAAATIHIDRIRGAGGEAVVELLPAGAQRDLATLLRRFDATAAAFSATVPGLVTKVVNRTADIRWDRVDRWLDPTVRAGEGRWVMQDALGRPAEPLGLPPRRWHMLRRAGGIASAAGLGVAIAGPFGWATAVAAAGFAAVSPIVSGFAGRAYDAGVRVTELHQSYPDPGQALRRRVPAAVVLVAARAVGRSVTAFSPPLREGLRGWRDVFAARAWALAHAEYTARALYKGELPSEYNEPVMDRMDAMLGRVAEALATTRHARFRQGRSGPTDSERAQLNRLTVELQRAAEQLEATARQRKRRYAAQRLDRLRNRPPKGLPSGWTHQRRRAPISALTGAADRALGALAEDPQAGSAIVVESSGGQSLALAEKWVAVHRYRSDSGLEAAVMSRRVREYAAATRRLRDGVPERPGLHRPRNDPAHWPIYRKRGMPDYAAHALRAHTATGGHAMAYLAWAGLGNWRARQLSSLVSKVLPKVSTSSVLIGAGSTTAFGLVTKSLDWRYREVKERAAFRQRIAHLLRRLGATPAAAPDLGRLAGEVAELRSLLESEPGGTATAVPVPYEGRSPSGAA